MQHLQPNTTLQGGKYRIERVLGQGGFGITYLAVQTSLNRYVAIKELFIGGEGQAINDRRGNQVVVTNSANQQSFNQQRGKFKKEAMRLANLNHPNLVKVHEFFEENGTAYYVMDYIDGESLRTKLNREGVLSENLVLKYLQQLLPALETAHKQSIWHLDIKPENIMVDRYGHVYLIDFGASKHVEPNSTLTTSLALAYTPGYCPPELLDLSNETPEYYLQAIKDIGPWTDIYALGATIYNLLTDSIPPSKRRLDKEGRKAFSFPSNISSSTQDIIVWMMKPDRENRPQSVQKVLDRQNKPSTASGEETLVDNPRSKEENQIITANGVSFKMIHVEGGTFTMGFTPERDFVYLAPDAFTNGYTPFAPDEEKPAHRIVLSSYYIGETEVTQDLWKAVMGSNPSCFIGDNRPVENVSWEDCQEFITRLNQKTGRTFRLPTEAEWEFAARGGNKSKGYKYSGSNNIEEVAWYINSWYYGNSSNKTHAVKTKQSNELGIYDMSGNVWEWCQDWYGSYDSSVEINPTGSSSGSYRVIRGGSWDGCERLCRVANRDYYSPSIRNDSLGLRLAL